MIVFACVFRQLDSRCRPVEHLATAVEYELVVRRHEGERDRKRDPKASREEHAMVKPSEPSLGERLLIIYPFSKQCPQRPDPVMSLGCPPAAWPAYSVV